jgi:hypothetical protein
MSSQSVEHRLNKRIHKTHSLLSSNQITVKEWKGCEWVSTNVGIRVLKFCKPSFTFKQQPVYGLQVLLLPSKGSLLKPLNSLLWVQKWQQPPNFLWPTCCYSKQDATIARCYHRIKRESWQKQFYIPRLCWLQTAIWSFLPAIWHSQITEAPKNPRQSHQKNKRFGKDLTLPKPKSSLKSIAKVFAAGIHDSSADIT